MKRIKTRLELWATRMAPLKRVPEVAREVWLTSGVLVGTSVGLRLLLATLPSLVLWISKLLIDSLVAVNQSHHAAWTRLWHLLVLEFGLIILGDLISRISGYTDMRLADVFSHRMSIRILEHTEKLDLEDLENPVFQDHLERARTQISTQLAVLFSIAQLIQSVVALVVLVAAVALYAPWLVGLQIISLVPLAILEMHYAAVLHRVHRERTPLRRTMEYLMNLCTASTSAKEVKAFRLGRHFINEYDATGTRFKDENARIARSRNISGGLLTTVGTAAYYAAYAYLVSQAGRGLISIGTLVFLGGSFQRSKFQMQDILAGLSRTLDQTMHLGDVFEFFRLKPRPRREGVALHVPERAMLGVEFKAVSFSYMGSQKEALHDVSFSIKPGETVALVGENGAGKSTLTKLLARLYEPTEGEITLDGIDIRDYDIASYQKAISIVFQDFIRYETTAALNIGFGDVDRRDDKAKIRNAAASGFALPIIERLADGFDQMLGRRFDGGTELSGGEWQRFAFARSCMRSAQLLILDEPSASLDVHNEFLLMDQFARLTEGKMAVIISHRLPTVRIADRILFLDNGRIIEQGTHEELLSYGGPYAAMFRLQASGYADHFQYTPNR